LLVEERGKKREFVRSEGRGKEELRGFRRELVRSEGRGIENAEDSKKGETIINTYLKNI